MPLNGFVSSHRFPRQFHRIPLLLGLAVLLAAASVASVSAAGDAAGPTTGRYIVLLEDSVEHPGAVARAQTAQRDGRVGFVYRHALTGYSAVLPKGAVKGLRKDARVAHVEPDVRGGAAAQTTPTGIDRIFATANEALDIDGNDDLRADVDVAVLDSGIDDEHPDLDVVGKVDCNSTEVCTEGGTDGNGHGTHVAGTIAAIDNGEGVVGVAPGARLWAVKVLDSGGFGSLSQFVAGVDWITATREDEDPENDIEVANASLRYFTTSSPAVTAALKAAVEAGVVPVVAAGNESEPVQYVPGNDIYVITVSALTDYDGQPGGESSPSCENQGSDDDLASFSNYGSLVEVAAPGVCIYSTLPGGTYGNSSGTSMASPHVAGAAAILASQSSPESLEDVVAIRDTILEEGNFGWEDTSGDGKQEPLLDVGDEEVFAIAAGEAEEPSATTDSATGVGIAGATLRGNVNPNGSSTTYQFEYGTTTSYGTKVPVSPKGIGSGSSGVEVSEAIGKLAPTTTYHYRVVATNAGGTVSGEDKTFKTQKAKAPTATTEAATGVTSSGATLRGTVNPNGISTTYQFEYGTTTAYGTKVPVSPKGIGSGGSGVEVSEAIGGLAPSTTYHFRVVATNSAGTVNGADKTFVTSEVPEESEWEIQPTPNPSEAEGSVQSLQDVSCNTVGMCMAVGAYSGPGGSGVLTERWNGEAWTSVASSTGIGLNDVVCIYTAISECGAVGSKKGQAAGQLWKESTGWYSVLTPSPPGATSSELSSVACMVSAPSIECLGVGSYIASGEEHPLSMRWSVEKQEFELLSTPTAGGDAELNGVSCNAIGSCVAVGSYVEAGEERPLAMHWNGSEWSAQPVPGSEAEGTDTYLNDVACTGAAGFSTRCIAVGANEGESSQVAVGMHWDGEEWSEVAPDEPAGLEGDFAFDSVSCVSESDCYAVGEYDAGQTMTLIEKWDGGEWEVSASPNPEGSSSSELSGVSCVAASADCAAVGSFEGPTKTDTLALHKE